MVGIVDKIAGEADEMGLEPADLVGYLLGQDRFTTEMQIGKMHESHGGPRYFQGVPADTEPFRLLYGYPVGDGRTRDSGH
jgi:hypothetical protein